MRCRQGIQAQAGVAPSSHFSLPWQQWTGFVHCGTHGFLSLSLRFLELLQIRFVAPDTNISDDTNISLTAVVISAFIRSSGKKAFCPITTFLDVTNSKLAEILEILERHFAANLLGLAISVLWVNYNET